MILKHISDDNIIKKLPAILSLFNELSMQDTGTGYIVAFLQYLSSTVENITETELKTIIEQSIVGSKGDLIMTLAEQWENKGFQKGKEQGISQGISQGMQKGISQGMQKGMQQGISQGIEQGIKNGLIEGIELAVHLKFGVGSDSKKLIELIHKINNVDQLKAFKSAILDAKNIPELIYFLSK